MKDLSVKKGTPPHPSFVFLAKHQLKREEPLEREKPLNRVLNRMVLLNRLRIR